MSTPDFLRTFVSTVLAPAGADAVGWITTFKVPPEVAGNAEWNGHKCHPADLPAINGVNAYYSVAAFPADAEARKGEAMLGTCVVLLDDVGTKVSTKRVLAMLGAPSYRIETSPGNEQWGYLLHELASKEQIKPIHDRLLALNLSDRNGLGPVRYGRLPAGINNKPEYAEPFVVTSKAVDLARRFHVADIAALLNVVGTEKKPPLADRVDELIQQITSGTDYHEPINLLAMHYGQLGITRVQNIAIIQSFMRQSADGSARWQTRYDDIPRAVDTALEKLNADGPERPIIMVRAGQLPETVNAALSLLADRGIAAGIFSREGQLVRPFLVKRRGFRDTEVPSLELEPLTTRALQCELGKLAQFKRFSRGEKNSLRIIKQDCPTAIAQTVLEMPSSWGHLPRLHALSSVPIYLGDGRLLSTPGYHADREVWITCPAGVAIPQAVTKELCLAALARLREWIAEFPFANALSEGVMLAAMMTAALRPSLPTAPGFVFDAPKHGIGKSTGAKAANIIATGRMPAVMEFHRNEEELRKSIDAAQMQGRESLVFDNVPTGVPIASATLAQVLSEPERDPRVLGLSASRKVPCTQLVLMTGNNVSVVGELARRLLATRLEPEVQSLTRVFKRPDLLDDLMAQRAQVLSDIFTIVAGGAYGAEAPPALVGYTQWSEWVQQPLVALGVADPVLSALEQEAEDPVQMTRNRIISLWSELHGTRYLKAKELTGFKSTIEEHAPDKSRFWELKDLLKEVAGEGREERVINTRLLGDWLRANRGIWTDEGMRIEWLAGKAGHPASWRVCGRRSAVNAVEAVDGTEVQRGTKDELLLYAGVQPPPLPPSPPSWPDPDDEDAL